MKQYELVKLEEVKDTPVLNIRELAKNPIKKTGPKRRTTLILIMFLSVLFSGLYLILFKDFKKYYLLTKLNNINSK